MSMFRREPTARIVPPSHEAVAVHEVARWCGAQVIIEQDWELGPLRVIQVKTPIGIISAVEGNAIIKHTNGDFEVVDRNWS
jgi:hypothetical protein